MKELRIRLLGYEDEGSKTIVSFDINDDTFTVDLRYQEYLDTFLPFQDHEQEHYFWICPELLAQHGDLGFVIASAVRQMTIMSHYCGDS